MIKNIITEKACPIEKKWVWGMFIVCLINILVVSLLATILVRNKFVNIPASFMQRIIFLGYVFFMAKLFNWIELPFPFIILGQFLTFLFMYPILVSVLHFSFSLWVISCSAAVLLLSVVILSGLVLYRNSYHFELGNEAVVINKGIIFKSRRQFLYGRIQNITVNQDIVCRLLRLASVEIETASEDSVNIRGLSLENALKVKGAVLNFQKVNLIDDGKSGL